MKIPKWNVARHLGVFLFQVVCFFVGYAVVLAVSLGQIKYDNREGPGWNPVTRMPDGKIGLSETAIGGIGFVAVAFGLAALIGFGFIWNRIWLGS